MNGIITLAVLKRNASELVTDVLVGMILRVG